MIAPAFGDFGERAPGPARELALAELVGDPDRLLQISLGVVVAPELALADPALGVRVPELPPRAEVLEDADRAFEPLDRLLVPLLVLQDPRTLHGRHRDAELVAALLGERARLVAELQRPLERRGPGRPPASGAAGLVDRQRVEGPHPRPTVVGVGDLERAAPDALRLLVVAAGPRRPPREQQRAGQRPRPRFLAEAVGLPDGLVEQGLRLVDVPVDVDDDVTQETQRDRERERVVDVAAELDRAVERCPGGRVVAEPVAGLADPGERPRLA